MKTRTRRHPFLSSNHALNKGEARTGEHCPITGWWIPAGEEDPQFLTEGSIMPSRLRHSTSWSLVTSRLESGELESASAARGAQ
jgi:hypothetical protein